MPCCCTGETGSDPALRQPPSIPAGSPRAGGCVRRENATAARHSRRGIPIRTQSRLKRQSQKMVSSPLGFGREKGSHDASVANNTGRLRFKSAKKVAVARRSASDPMKATFCYSSDLTLQDGSLYYALSRGPTSDDSLAGTYTMGKINVHIKIVGACGKCQGCPTSGTLVRIVDVEKPAGTRSTAKSAFMSKL